MFAPPLPHNTSHVTTPPSPTQPQTDKSQLPTCCHKRPSPRSNTLLVEKKYLSPTPRRRMLTPPSPTAPARQVAYTDVLSQAAVPRRHTLLVEKKIYKKTAKPIIFHPRAGGPEGIRASDLKAPYQNCLVVQRPAKRLFVPPYLPPRAGFSPLMLAPPSPTPPLILTSFAR